MAAWLVVSRGSPNRRSVRMPSRCSSSTTAGALRSASWPRSTGRYLPQAGGGAYAARNRGVEAAQGEILAFTDADCLPPPAWLSAIEAALAQDDCDVVGGPSYALNGDPVGTMVQAIDDERWARLAAAAGPVTYCDTRNLAGRRELFAREPFDEAFRHGGDIEWAVRAARRGYRIAFVPGMALGHENVTSLGDVWRRGVRRGRGVAAICRKHGADTQISGARALTVAGTDVKPQGARRAHPPGSPSPEPGPSAGGQCRPPGAPGCSGRGARLPPLGPSPFPPPRPHVPLARPRARLRATPPPMTPAPPPFVSVVVETSTWTGESDIVLADTLCALAGQTYPRDRFEVIVVLGHDRDARTLEMTRPLDGLRVVQMAAPASYYALKREGVRHARGEIVAFVDADNRVAPPWLEEIIRPFAGAREIAAVLGRVRYQESFLSRMWDVLWWSRAYEREGPIDRLFSANNLAVRRPLLEADFFHDPGRYRGLWERVMSDRLQQAGGRIWLAPRAVLFHAYRPGLGRFVQMALARGYTLLAIRFEHPQGLDVHLARARWLAPWLVFPGLVAKDVWRILTRTPRTGLAWWHLWKVPLYLLACLPLELFVLAGMVLATTRRPAPQVP